MKLNMRQIAKVVLDDIGPTKFKSIKTEFLADLMVKNGYLQRKGKAALANSRTEYVATNKLWKKYSR